VWCLVVNISIVYKRIRKKCNNYPDVFWKMINWQHASWRRINGRMCPIPESEGHKMVGLAYYEILKHTKKDSVKMAFITDQWVKERMERALS